MDEGRAAEVACRRGETAVEGPILPFSMRLVGLKTVPAIARAFFVNSRSHHRHTTI